MSNDHQNENAPGLDTQILKAETRTEQAEARTERAEARTEQAKSRTEQAEVRTEQAETRIEQAKTRTEQAETRMEQAEAHSEQAEMDSMRLAAIIESSGDAIISKTLDGIITSWNRGAEKVFGYPAQEAVGRPMLMLIPPGRDEEEREILARIRRGESVDHFETVRVRKDGKLIDVSITISPLKDGGGKIIGASKIARDITERKKSEEARQASEARYRTLFDYAPDGIVIADSGSYYLDANASICRMLGYSREELIGKHASDIVVPAEIQHIAPALDEIKTKSNYHREWQFRRKDGSVFAAEVIATKMPDGNLMGMIRDITERKLAEEKIHQLNVELEQRVTQRTAELDRFFTLSLDMLCIASADGYFKRISPAFTQTLGWSREEILGQPFLKFVHPDDHAITLREVERQIVAGEKVLQFENRYRHKDGSWRVLSWNSVPQPGGLMYAVARDVTKSKHQEEEIRQINDQLLQKATALQAANKELEAFSYSVSHDLRAPLRAVNGFAGIVLEDFGPQLPEEGRDYLERIRNGGRRMGVLIDDLLAFSQLSRESMNRRPVDTGRLVQDVLDELKAQLDGRQIEIKTGELPACHGDAALLKQVWVNLVSNAVKYTRGREPAIVEIGCARENGEDVFFVRDNGAGFDMQYAGKLFGVFQRLHRSDEFEGTGVGLAIVQRIVHRHGGRVWAKAEVDRGATFYFTLGETKL